MFDNCSVAPQDPTSTAPTGAPRQHQHQQSGNVVVAYGSPKTEREHLTLCSSSVRCRHSGTGMLPSAMPSASLSSSCAKREKPSYRAQSRSISAPVQVSSHCLKVGIESASD